MKYITLLAFFVSMQSCENEASVKKGETVVISIADTVTVYFFNGSLPPKYQFFSTLKLFKYGYIGITEFGDSAKRTKITKGVIGKSFWEEISAFSKNKLNSQIQNDGESISIHYLYMDSVYVDYPQTVTEKETKLITLLNL